MNWQVDMFCFINFFDKKILSLQSSIMQLAAGQEERQRGQEFGLP